MTDPNPDPGQGPDDPDLEDPLTADDIVNHPDGPAVVRSLRGKDGLRSRLSSLYFDIHHQAPGGAALTDALAVLEGRAESAARQLAAFLDMCTDDRLFPLLQLASHTGARRSELLALRSSLDISRPGGRHAVDRQPANPSRVRDGAPARDQDGRRRPGHRPRPDHDRRPQVVAESAGRRA